MRTTLVRLLNGAFRRGGKRSRKPTPRGANQSVPPIGVLADGAQWHLVGRQSLNRTNGRIETQLVLAPK